MHTHLTNYSRGLPTIQHSQRPSYGASRMKSFGQFRRYSQIRIMVPWFYPTKILTNNRIEQLSDSGVSKGAL